MASLLPFLPREPNPGPDAVLDPVDLSVLLRKITAPRMAVPALVLLAMCFPGTGSLSAQSTSPAAPEGRGGQLSQNIERVLQGTEYQWRMPRDGAAKVEESSWLASGFKDLGAWINSIF